VLFRFQFLLDFFEQTDDSARVADIAVLLKVGADLEGLLAPERAIYAPVERVLECTAVEVLWVRRSLQRDDSMTETGH
jgi:hypothetical protein